MTLTVPDAVALSHQGNLTHRVTIRVFNSQAGLLRTRFLFFKCLIAVFDWIAIESQFPPSNPSSLKDRVSYIDQAIIQMPALYPKPQTVYERQATAKFLLKVCPFWLGLQ